MSVASCSRTPLEDEDEQKQQAGLARGLNITVGRLPLTSYSLPCSWRGSAAPGQASGSAAKSPKRQQRRQRRLVAIPTAPLAKMRRVLHFVGVLSRARTANTRYRLSGAMTRKCFCYASEKAGG